MYTYICVRAHIHMDKRLVKPNDFHCKFRNAIDKRLTYQILGLKGGAL